MSQRAGKVTASSSEPPVKPKDDAQAKQAMLLAQDTGHFSLVKAMHLADVVTELNGFCGFMAILCAIKYALGDPLNVTNLWLAFFYMPLGLLFDFFDGKVARWRGKSSLMGQELDSLADLVGHTPVQAPKQARRLTTVRQVSFGVAPATVAFSIGFRTTIDQLLLAFYVLCGLTRLARFNVTVAMLPKDKTGKSQYFEGTPIPFACLTSSAFMATCTAMGMLHDKLPLGTVLQGTILEFHPVAVLFVVNGCLMVSKTLHVPKP